MTAPGPWQSPEGRPAPFLDRHGDLITPAEDLAETAYWHELVIGYIEGRPPPASAKQPRVTAKLRLYAAIHRQGAKDVAADRARAARAAPNPAPPTVLDPAQMPSPSAAEEITTAQAEDLTGLSAERWRQLARAGRIRSRRTHRQVLLLNRADVIAYDGDRRRRGTSGGQDARAGDPGGPAGGGAAGGSRAA